MAKKAKGDNPTSNILELGASLTIDVIKELQINFASMAKLKADVTFHSNLIESIDQTGIQFLIYANKVANNEGFETKFDFKLSDSGKDLLSKTGFSYLLEGH